MDEEDEIESNPSLSPVHQNGGGAGGGGGSLHPVTVASAPPSHHLHHHQTLTLALPIQHPRTTTGAVGGGREDCWSEGATSTLIDAWGERYLELSRGNLKQKHWKDVADIVSSREDYTKPSKTDVQCKNRIDTLKKKYKLEKAKISSGGSSAISKWNFFNRLDHLIGTNSKMIPPGTATAAAASAAPMPTTPIQGNNNKVPVAIPVGVVHPPPPPRTSFYHHQSSPNHQNQHHHSNYQQQQQQQQHMSQMQNRRQQQHQQQQQQKRKRYRMEDSDSSEPDASPDSTDSFPPETFNRKRPQFQREPPNSNDPIRPPAGAATGGFRQNMGSSSRDNNNNNNNNNNNKNAAWGSSIMELTRAIMKFGEAYEQVETSKLQQVMEMEQQRMEFTKELELQRMQFFMKAQLEFTQLNHGRRGAGNNHRRHNNNNNSNNNNNNSNNNSSGLWVDGNDCVPIKLSQVTSNVKELTWGKDSLTKIIFFSIGLRRRLSCLGVNIRNIRGHPHMSRSHISQGANILFH